MSKAIKEYLKQNGLNPKEETPKPGAEGGKPGEGGGAPAGDAGEGAGDGGDAGAGSPAGGTPPAGSGEGGQQQQQQGAGGEGAGAGAADDDDIPEEKLLAALAKKGHKITSLADLNKPAPPAKELTPEEQEAASRERQDNIRQFALRSKKVTSTQFDNYVKETSLPPVELAFRLYKDERLQELKEAKTPAEQMPEEKDLRAEFDEAHFQYADENDPKRKRHEKILQQQVDSYIEDKYANILDLDEEYTQHEQMTIKRRDYEQTIDTVIAGIGEELEFEIQNDKDKFPFKFKITPEVTAAIKQAYGNDASFTLFGQGNVNKELIAQAIKGNIIQREFAKILSEGAAAYASSKLDSAAKGRRGIPPERKETGSEGGEKKVNKTVQALLNQAENKQVLQPK